MRFPKNRSRVVAATAVVVLLTAGWLAFKPSHKAPTTTSTPVTSQTTRATPATKGADPAKLVTIEAADFKYAKPVGWAKISQKTLDSIGAASGIGRPTDPVASFSINESDSIPKNNDELKNSVLSAPKHLQNFELISSETLKIDGQGGQKFTYTFTDSTGNKITQQTSVVVYKQKAFILLFSSAAANYDKQTGDFANILASFHFK